MAEGYRILHPDLGVKAVKPKDLRQPVPGDIVLLKRMWEAACDARDAPSLDVCCVCRVAGGEPPPHLCPMCLRTWHRGCSAEVAQRADVKTMIEDMGAVPASMPNDFRGDGALCALCTAWTARG